MDKHEINISNRRGGKTNKQVDSVVEYLKTFTKKEREEIQRELEAEDEEDEDHRPRFADILWNKGCVSGAVIQQVTHAWWRNQISTAIKPIEEEANDVSFED